MAEPSSYLTTGAVARIAGVRSETVARWADEKLIPCVRTGGGHRRFRREDVNEFLSQHGHDDTGVEPEVEVEVEVEVEAVAP